MNARTASLYIYDTDSESFILRSQAGWAKPEWVGAARYRKSEGLTGTVALMDMPRHIPDVREWRKDSDRSPSGKYGLEMFALELEAEGTVTIECIGLPLKIGTQASLGVLTLHSKRPCELMSTLFATTDQVELQHASDNVASVVRLFMWNEEMISEREENKRLATILKVFAHGILPDTMQSTLRDSIVSEFRADRLDLYLAPYKPIVGLSSFDKQINLLWKGSSISARTPLPPGALSADDMVISAARLGQVEHSRRSPQPGDAHDPQIAITHYLIDRACVPLLANNKLYGVLDIRWYMRMEFSPLPTRNLVKELYVLGNAIGQRLAAAEAEWTARRFISLCSLAGKVQHDFLGKVASELTNVSSDPKRAAVKVPHVLRNILKAWKAAEIARSMENAMPTTCTLREIVDQAVAEVQCKPLVQVHVDNSVQVFVVREEVLEALRNLLRNAKDAVQVRKASRRTARIVITASEDVTDKTVRVAIVDSGIGIASERLATLTELTTGMGLPLARILIQLQHGTLDNVSQDVFDIKSDKGQGTTVSFALPWISSSGK
jgi:hypothetical protein